MRTPGQLSQLLTADHNFAPTLTPEVCPPAATCRSPLSSYWEIFSSLRLSTFALVAIPFLLLAQLPPESVLRPNKRFDRRVVTNTLAGPWEITWGPDNMLWVTERSGKRVTRVNPSTGQHTVAVTIPEVLAPGGQDGLLGMALDPGLLKNNGHDFVYVSYTYKDEAKGPDPHITDSRNPYRFLYMKVVRFTYSAATATLASPQEIITGLPAGNDHNAGRLKFGPDQKLYLTIGDQGYDQLGNFCFAIQSQRLPTQKEIDARDYAAYEGKSLRINLDGSVPKDNPKINGVVSHVFTYGHRNPQGLDFGPGGTLYSSEQGPKTDDEVNILRSGGNYGWPHVVGFRDNKAYQFARWADSKPTPCSQLRFSDLAIHPEVPREDETAFTKPMVDPLATMFTVPTGFNFADPACKGVDFRCWPTVATSSIEYYANQGAKGIPGWDQVLLVTTLKRGSLYVLPLKADGKSAAGPFWRFFHSEFRYRDTAVDPNLRTLYIATDSGRAGRGNPSDQILAYTYASEGEPAPEISDSASAKPSEPTLPAPPPVTDPAKALAPQFTAAQASAGKTAYNSGCAVCHGSTLTNGTFGPPLAGAFFKNRWSNRAVRALYDRSVKTMPPASPASLPKDTYAEIVAYILEINGYKPGSKPSGIDAALDGMAIK